ncbi:MAG: GPP34 family phosphoprotein [Sporichthyaceae bacterium]|nr:GPP34 family phosphoprotein [Sporichthyaceae bacterium]
MESIGAQVWLVAYDVAKGGAKGGRQLGYTIAGGLLCDLVLRGKLQTDGAACRPVDPSPLGCPALDDLLGRIAAEADRPRTWLSWIRGYGRDASAAVIEELEQHGRLVRYERRVLRLLALTRHSLADPMRADRLHADIRHVMSGVQATPPEPRQSALALLVAGFAPGLTGVEPATAAARATELEADLPDGLRAVLAAVRATRIEAVAAVF